MVGDRLYTDIACGINGGGGHLCSLHRRGTKSDILTPGEPNTQYLPDYAFENVQELLNACQGEINLNSSLHDTDSQRIRSGVYANGGTDLEDGNGVDVVSLFFSVCLPVCRGTPHGFFIIVATPSHADVGIGNICLFLTAK